MNTISNFLPKEVQKFLQTVAVSSYLLSSIGCSGDSTKTELSDITKKALEEQSQIPKPQREIDQENRIEDSKIRMGEVKDCYNGFIDSTTKRIHISKQCLHDITVSFFMDQCGDHNPTPNMIEHRKKEIIESFKYEYKESHPQFKLIIE